MSITEELIIKVEKQLVDAKVFRQAGIVVGFSGGRDSCVLLDILYKMGSSFDLKIAVAYINHNLRGKDSDDEECFVEDRAANFYKLPFYKKVIDKGYFDELTGESIESGARKIRYSFFNEVASSLNFDFIATAHNFNDKIETFFLNILRGGGSETLRSIPAVNGNVIRPLIDVSRDEINLYVAENRLLFIEDKTNSENIYKRNVIRNKVIPQLKSIAGNINSSFESVFKHINEDIDFINGYTDTAYNSLVKYNCYHATAIDRTSWHYLHSALKNRIIKKIFEEYGEIGRLNKSTIETISDQEKLNFKKGELSILSKGKYIWFFKEPENFIEKTINKIPYEDDNIKVEKTDFIADAIFMFYSDNFPIYIENIDTNAVLKLHKGDVNIIKRLGERGVPEKVARCGVVVKNSMRQIVGYICGCFFEVSPDFYVKNIENAIHIKLK